MSRCLTPEELADFLAGELSAPARAEAESHLAECGECRRELEARRADNQLFVRVQAAHRPAKSSETDGETRTVGVHPRVPDTYEPTLEGYEILSEIHRGGQGVVYKAVQKATKRVVAIKILLSGRFASPRERLRFQREVDLVASLNHPNIVTVYDSGISKDERLFLVMEYIHGVPLDTFVSRSKLSVTETLRLFETVCHAAGYAHSHGVIHRDLKPSNICVGADGTPHILDFGLAKAAGSGLSPDGSPVTMTGTFLGTLAYASPEQTQGDPQLSDVRTDVYSLGVVLYELLTGKRLYRLAGPIDEAMKVIREDTPTRPSSHNKLIGDEVDTIVLKALAKERERRYHTAAAMADDIARYLAGEAIEAKRESTVYLLRKALRRHRLPVAVTLAMLTIAAVSLSLVWASHRNLRNTQIADRYIHTAAAFIANREQLSDARSLLDQALSLDTRSEYGFLYRGILNAIEGLGAPLHFRTQYVERAINDFRQAHLAADGVWPKEDDPVPSSGVAGSTEALLYAADLSFVAQDNAEAQQLLRLANSISQEGNEGDQRRSPAGRIAVYDPARDSLLREPRSKTPSQAHAEPDLNAVLHRPLPSRVRSLHPQRAKSVDVYVVNMLSDPLFFGDSHGRALPNEAMVDQFHPCGENRISRIVLRRNLTWHDGSPLTAADVAFSWRQLPEDNAAKKGIKEVVAVDDHNLEFHYSHRELDPGQVLKFALLPKAWFDRWQDSHPGAAEDDAHDAYALTVISNGPYRLEHAGDDRIVLSRWDSYPGPQAYMRRIEFHVLDTREKRLDALVSGDIHELELSALEFRWHVNGSSFEDGLIKIRDDRWTYDFICWNISSPLFQDTQVRRALTLALDRRQIIAMRHGGLYSVCSGIYHPLSWVANPKVEPFEYDPQRANDLLTRAGWILGTDGIRHKRGLRFVASVLVPETSTETLMVLADMRSQLSDVGVAIQVEVVPLKEWRERRDRGEFEAYLGSVHLNIHSQGSRRWTTGGSVNRGGYSNAEVDSLYVQAARATDETAQQRLHFRIHKLIHDDQPYTFLWWRPTLWVLDEELRGVQVSPVGLTRFYPGPRAWWFPKNSD